MPTPAAEVSFEVRMTFGDYDPKQIDFIGQIARACAVRRHYNMDSPIDDVQHYLVHIAASVADPCTLAEEYDLPFLITLSTLTAEGEVGSSISNHLYYSRYRNPSFCFHFYYGELREILKSTTADNFLNDLLRALAKKVNGLQEP